MYRYYIYQYLYSLLATPYWLFPVCYAWLSLSVSVSLSLYIYIDIFIHTISMCIALVNQWREVSKVRKQGAIPPQPAGSKIGFIFAFQQWLEERSP